MAPSPSPRTLRAIVLAALLGGCGGDATAPDPVVASIDITGTPASAIAVGTSVKLTATVRNARGDRLDGRKVTWLSGDPLVAWVSDSGKVTALDGGSALITASAEGITGRTTILIAPLGVYAVGVTPATPKLYPDGSILLHADVKDSTGRLLSGRTIVWQTSDASKATVDASGMVRAVATGTATITAAADGVSGSTTVTVIPRAVTDWSGAADWTTFQGNASHSGYVPVTLDPNAINRRWTADFTGTAMNPVATGHGRVFVTTSDKRLTVLDERTGAQQWAYVFGGADNVNAPAYGDSGVFVQTGGQERSYFWGFDDGGTMRFRTPYLSQWQTYLAPVIAGRSLYAGGGRSGGMYALSSTAGVSRWFATLDANDRFTPAVRDGLVYAYSAIANPRLTVVDATSGTLTCEIADTGFVQQRPALEMAPALGTMNDAIITQGGRVVAFDLAARRVKWQATGNFSGSVAIANGAVYVAEGLTLRALDESTGLPLWSWTAFTAGGTLGNPVATDNVVFVGDGYMVYALDIRSRTVSWQTTGLRNVAVTREGLLLVPDLTGLLVAYTLR